MSYVMHNTHFILVLVSLLVYFIRGAMMLAGNTSKSMMTLAAVTTLILFGTGLALVFSSDTMTFANSWVMTKMVGTLLYVFFGVIALKSGLSKTVAIILWLLGLAAFAYTFAIAKGLLSPIA
ncbi:MAG TPA: hypothetical protein EYG68_03205 [Leucothrix mucor]|nr:hypothetical protein [Leucothrix mucor]